MSVPWALGRAALAVSLGVAGCGKSGDDGARRAAADPAASAKPPAAAIAPAPPAAGAARPASPELGWIGLPPQQVVGWLKGPAPTPFRYQLTLIQGFVDPGSKPRRLDDDSVPPYYTNSHSFELAGPAPTKLLVVVEVEEATLEDHAARGPRTWDATDHTRTIVRQEATADGWIIVWKMTSKYFEGSGGVDVEIARRLGPADSKLVVACVASLHSESAFAHPDRFGPFLETLCGSLTIPESAP